VSLWTRLAGLFSVERKAADEASGAFVQRLMPWTVPPRRGSAELLRLYRSQPWLRAAASRVATACASTNIKLYRVNAKGVRTEVVKHEALDLLADPNPLLGSRALRKITQVHVDLVGDGLWVKERNRAGVPCQLVPVPPHWIRSFPSQGNPNYLLSWRGATRSIDQKDVVRFQDPDPDEPFGRGTGLGEALADEVDTDEFAAKYTKSWFANFGAPGIMVSVDGASEVAMKGVQAKFDEFQGSGKQHRPLFTSGKIKVERLDTTFRDSNLVGVRDQMRDIIVSVWGLPPEILGILTSSNRATIDGADVIMAKYCVTPRLDTYCDALNHGLAWEYGDDLEFGYENPVPEDRAFKLLVMQARPAAFTDNEVRILAGEPEADGKDEYPQPFSAPTLSIDEPEWARRLRLPKRAPADGGTASPEHAKNALEALRAERLTVRVNPEYLATVEAWGKRALEKIGASPKFDLLNPLFAPFVAEQSTTKITGYVSDTTREELRASLEEGVRAGESIRDLRDRVEDVFDAADQVRASAIARTEVVGAANWATSQAHKVSGVVSKRAWVATRDGRTRETHAAMDGQEVGINDKFTSPSGSTADHPGAFGDAAEDIQCRCATVAVIDDPPDDSEDAVPESASTARLDVVWRAFDARLKGDEKRFERALRRGFADQRDDVLATLK